jgi:hypothetical protein
MTAAEQYLSTRAGDTALTYTLISCIKITHNPDRKLLQFFKISYYYITCIFKQTIIILKNRFKRLQYA